MKTAKLYLTRNEYHSGGLQGQCTVGIFPRQPQENNGVVCLKLHHCSIFIMLADGLSASPGDLCVSSSFPNDGMVDESQLPRFTLC